ncbi:hypothetical protein EJ08DRAFT_256288 [Tothia fuscella]|uniref:Uncharacterized protein n=1 Tax=Tothia fuscella TaxID=1048955 RepID=A0A9P4NRP6_9PEZI|nr:hypothetical protein EJ08DRAFT_256288 [Tothia fuscella]
MLASILFIITTASLLSYHQIMVLSYFDTVLNPENIYILRKPPRPVLKLAIRGAEHDSPIMRLQLPLPPPNDSLATVKNKLGFTRKSHEDQAHLLRLDTRFSHYANEARREARPISPSPYFRPAQPFVSAAPPRPDSLLTPAGPPLGHSTQPFRTAASLPADSVLTAAGPPPGRSARPVPSAAPPPPDSVLVTAGPPPSPPFSSQRSSPAIHDEPYSPTSHIPGESPSALLGWCCIQSKRRANALHPLPYFPVPSRSSDTTAFITETWKLKFDLTAIVPGHIFGPGAPTIAFEVWQSRPGSNAYVNEYYFLEEVPPFRMAQEGVQVDMHAKFIRGDEYKIHHFVSLFSSKKGEWHCEDCGTFNRLTRHEGVLHPWIRGAWELSNCRHSHSS